MNCWEFKKCGKENTCVAGISAKFDGYFGGKNGGRFCAFIDGTECASGKYSSSLEKFTNHCSSCDFYKKLMKDCLPADYHQSLAQLYKK
ncbi:MAG: hypothetical protein HQL93_04310 [Magnetococcales bacterium]|nr:hypothetical protein [Magnetococcales bacterium]